MADALLVGWVAVRRGERFAAARLTRPGRWHGWREARAGDYAVYELDAAGTVGELREVVDALTFRRRYEQDAEYAVVAGDVG
jgi:muconolactone delta-isomerase